jgi:hypothetical protein
MVIILSLESQILTIFVLFFNCYGIVIRFGWLLDTERRQVFVEEKEFLTIGITK